MPDGSYFAPVRRLLHVCGEAGCAELVPYGQARCEEHSRGSDRRTRAYRKTRELILERDQHRCQAVVLGADPAECAGGLECHHIVDVARGGTDEPTNMTILCRSHNGAARRGGRPARWVRDLEALGPPALRRRGTPARDPTWPARPGAPVRH